MIAHMLMAGILTLGAVAAQDGHSYYVSPNGSDSSAGTLKSPWKTPQRAADSAGPGDTVYIMPGTYTQSVLLRKSGEEGRPITFSSYGEEKPVIDGQSSSDWRGVVSVVGAQHVVLSGLHVINGLGRGQSGIFLQDCGHVTVQGCHTFKTGSSGVKLIHCTDAVVDGNEIEWGTQSGSEEDITVKIDSDRVQVSNNYIHNSRDEGIDVKEGARNVRVFGNLICDIERQGLYADAWNRETFNITFSGNIVRDCGFGLAVGAETGGLLHDVSFVNNIVINCEGPGMVVASWGRQGSAHPMDGIRFINNTLYKAGTRWGGGVALDDADAKNVIIRNNICAECGAPTGLASSPPAGWQYDHNLFTAKGEGQGADPVIGDAKFVDAEAGNLHIQAGSAAVDAGSAEGAPALDIDGQKRPAGKRVDIGADELSDEPPVEKPTGPTVKEPVSRPNGTEEANGVS
jgi:polygalacturonase